jgi:hypothetical protein
VFDVALDALAYARERQYTGWDYADGMSSRLLRALPFDNRWVNLAVQETIKRAPVNLRPLFLVEQRRNFKGTGLFVLAHRNLDRLPESTVDHAGEVVRLADWLVDNQSPGYSGFCGGHRHQNQHLDHKTLPEEPDVVATSYAVLALLAAAEYRPRFSDVAETATEFLLEDMNYREVSATREYVGRLDHGADWRGEIESLTGRIQYLEQAAAFSSITVDLIPEAIERPLQIAGWTPGRTAESALAALINILQSIVDAVIVAVIVVVPLVLILGAPLWFGYRFARRRGYIGAPSSSSQ